VLMSPPAAPLDTFLAELLLPALTPRRSS
jgi:hypothetical protein